MKNISYCHTSEAIADYCYLNKVIITHKKRLRKQGLSGYWVERYKWYGKTKYLAIIDAMWFTETEKEFDNLRNAVEWICNKIKKHGNSCKDENNG